MSTRTTHQDPASDENPEMANGIGGPAVVYMTPRSLLLDNNIRLDPRLDKDFIGSIKDHGVLVPIIALRTTDGADDQEGEARFRVRLGHRRTLAAIEAGLAEVPVIVAGDDTASKAGQVERLVQQYAENEHRTGLSDAERIGVAEQLSAFGVSAAQIAKKTRMPRAQVDAALTAASSPLALAAAARYDLTIDQAATVAEFADEKDTVTALIAAVKTGQFEHIAQRARDDRTHEHARQTAIDTLTGQGVPVIEEDSISGAEELAWLTASENSKDPISAEAHVACPGHAAYLEHRWTYPSDDEDELETRSASGGRYEWMPVWVCTDPDANGHHNRYAPVSTFTPRAAEPKRVAELDDEERETARTERREVIENNKAWASAERVRRNWLKTYLTRKTAPKGTAQFMAKALAEDADTISSIGGNHLAARLLGATDVGYGRSAHLTELIAAASEARAQVIHLGIVLGAYEDATDREHWRTHRATTRRYLTHLATLGYEFSAVEQLAIG